MFTIVPYNNKYKDDTIFCILLAKDVLGRPRLNEDLLDISKNYLDKGDMFWLAIDDNDRVIGTIGTKIFSDSDMWLKRLYVKPNYKRQGIGSALLTAVENFAVSKNIKTIHTRFSDNYIEAFLFYSAKGFIETTRSDGLRHFVKSIRLINNDT